MVEIDIEDLHELAAYLRVTGRVGQDETIESRVLSGGVSNRTVWLERAGGQAWVLKQALKKLRVEVDWFSSPERIGREALGMSWLAKLTPAGSVPALVFEDPRQHLLAMEAVARPFENWKSSLLAGEVDERLVGQAAELLGAIHRNSFERREELAGVFAERCFFESLRLEPYYGFTATRVPASAGWLTELMNETRSTTLTLVHGDYSPKNMLIHKGRLILLDHEVIHWGDPAFDLGFFLAHLLSKAHHLPQHRAPFGQSALLFWRIYEAAIAGMPWRSGLEARAVRHTLACLLARVRGRSPLEYLDGQERSRQETAVLSLAASFPMSLSELRDRFLACLSSND